MEAIPRFEVQVNASVPHGSDLTSEALNTRLTELEETLQALGAEVTIQFARTTRTQQKKGSLAGYLTGEDSEAGASTGHYV